MSFPARDARESELESATLFDKFAAPMNPEDDSPENRMLYARLSALALRDAQHASIHDTDLAVPNRLKRAESDSSVQYGRQGEQTDRESFLIRRASGRDDDTEDDESHDGDAASGTRNTLKQLVKGRLGDYVYPSDSPSAEWELTARRRVLIATSRYKYVSSSRITRYLAWRLTPSHALLLQPVLAPLSMASVLPSARVSGGRECILGDQQV